ncbi:olfactory receptor 6B1-like [Anomaloglossus baeobatrachus]|uniref:olfactory receptor 6B1-like n=1 Tax=Anomaloglossus baeobatrachus TaxID=238106 RepID=UPI003F4FF284
MANQSYVKEFILFGFPGLQEKFFPVVSLTFFCVYNVSVCANATVLVLIVLRSHLHQPMYMIIANLAFSDLLFDTITLPKIICRYWFGDGFIPYNLCFFQMFFVHLLSPLDSFIILLMAVDRYVAICNPLRYHNIISNKVIAILFSFCWLMAAIISLTVMSFGMQLTYCGPNMVKNIYCAVTPVGVLSCADSLWTRKTSYYIGLIAHMGSLSFIIFSYIIILVKVYSTARNENWQKALYTCVTHWFVIVIHFVPRLVVYSYDQAQLMPNADINVLLICLYTYVPHVSSPIVFCLRTEEIKKTLIKILRKQTITL